MAEAPVITEELIFEDDELRVWRLSIPPGAMLDPAKSAGSDHWLCVLQGGRALVSAAGSTAWELNYSRGQSAFVRGDAEEQRALVNRGTEMMRLLRVELKR